MRGPFLRSSALALLFATVLPFGQPDLFVYRSALAESSPVVPDWIKASCCGPQDAHRLRADQVHRPAPEFYEVDGYQRRIPSDQALPSQDGDYWIFYRDSFSTTGGSPSQSGVYCFFIPMAF